MTFALANRIDEIELPTVAGVSPHAMQVVFIAMARWASDDTTGHLDGQAGTATARTARLSVSTTRRAQRALVDLGIAVKVKIGGGRLATTWRINVERLDELAKARHTSCVTVEQQVSQAGTRTSTSHRPSSSWRRFPKRTFDKRTATPDVRRAAPADRRTVDQPMCEKHDHPAGTTRDGKPACPGCRYGHRT
jgi:hypothetical protein